MNESHLVRENQTMSDVSVLLGRIDAEFSALEGKIKRAQGEKQQEHQERQIRLATFKRELDTLPEVWGPRLEALMARFGDQAEVAPRLESTSRAVTMDFESELARIRLRLSATTDQEIRNLVLNYDLETFPPSCSSMGTRRASGPSMPFPGRQLGTGSMTDHSVRQNVSVTARERVLPEGAHGPGPGGGRAIPQVCGRRNDGRGGEDLLLHWRRNPS